MALTEDLRIRGFFKEPECDTLTKQTEENIELETYDDFKFTDNVECIVKIEIQKVSPYEAN